MATKIKTKDKTVTSKTEVVQLVERGYELDSKGKKIKTELDSIKSKLKEFGKKEQKKVLMGVDHTAVISAHKQSKIDPRAFYEYLKKKRKLDDFFACASITMESAKGVVNELDLKEMTTSTENEYGAISFK